jgi:hypothetical protein
VTDIQAGDRWIQSVTQELDKSNFGIVCVTPENIDSPWILFESGALAKSLEAGQVIPLLFDLDFTALSGPLAQFQAKKLTREGLNEIIQSLQSSSEMAIPEERARRLFEAFWPELESKFSEIPRQEFAQRHVRPQNEILEELVTSVRALEVRMRQVLTLVEESSAGLSWKTAMGNAAGTGVRVAATGGSIVIGDAKNPDGPIVTYDASEFKSFIDGVKRGDFDGVVK